MLQKVSFSIKPSACNPHDYYNYLFEDELFLGADFSIRLGCLHVLVDSVDKAELICERRAEIKQRLSDSRATDNVDGVFIDSWDGSRFYAFRVGDKQKPLPRQYPFDVHPTMTVFDIISLGRVSPHPTILMEDQGIGNEMKTVYSNLDENGKTTGRWYGVVHKGAAETLANLSPLPQLISRRGTRYKLVQFVSGPVTSGTPRFLPEVY